MYAISSPVIKLVLDEKEIILYLRVFGLYPCKSTLAVAFDITDWDKLVVIWYAGNEFEATYILSLLLLYTFVISDVITLLPNSISVFALLAVFNFLLIS